MEKKTTLHPIHPTLQFEAKHAIRFLDNLLRTRTTAVKARRCALAGREVNNLTEWIFEGEDEF